MSRIDRFLISVSLMERWGVVSHYFCKRDISDHFPIWLKVNKEDWGVKSFKSNDSWFDNKGFLKLNKWNKEVFEWYDLKVEEGVEDINVVDKLMSMCVNEKVKDLVSRRNNGISYVWRHLYIRDNMLIQKSSVKWTLEWDFNSRFFHNVMKGRARRKFIGAVNSDNGVIDATIDVKEVVWRFFH
ncbi:unnamed protein product [Lathyrus oleraceus]